MTKPRYEMRRAKDLGFKEEWLQLAIEQDPRLVLDACEEAELTDELWFTWAREVSVEGGSIDVLLVSESGRVAIVETKLSYNPEKRRAVVAQVLEYAVALPGVALEALPGLPTAAKAIGLSVERVFVRIKEGDFLLVIAGDELDSRAVRLGQALLGGHLTRGWDLAMVEVAVYERIDEASEPRHVLVPHLRGRIAPEVRQVLKVHVSGARVEAMDVEEARPDAGPAGRQKWTEERFMAELDRSSLPSGYRAYARELLRLCTEFPGLVARWGTGKTGSLTLKRQGHGLAELYLDGTIAFRLERPVLALGEAAGAGYLEGLRALFPDDMPSEVDPNVPVHIYGPVDEEKLRGLVALLRKSIQSAI